MTWSEYVAKHLGGRPKAKLARDVGVDPTTIGRWLDGKGAPASAKSAIEFARAVGDNPVAALVAAGHLTAEEAGARVVIPGSSSLSAEELLNALAKRLGLGVAFENRSRSALSIDFHPHGVTIDDADQGPDTSSTPQPS